MEMPRVRRPGRQLDGNDIPFSAIRPRGIGDDEWSQDHHENRQCYLFHRFLLVEDPVHPQPSYFFSSECIISSTMHLIKHPVAPNLAPSRYIRPCRVFPSSSMKVTE